MLWQSLYLLILLYLISTFALYTINTKVLKMRSIKNEQIAVIDLKKDLISYNNGNSEEKIVSDFITRYNLALYQVVNKNDIYDIFLNSTKQWDKPYWMIFQGWNIWENKEVSTQLNKSDFEHLYILKTTLKNVNLIKVY